jgi:hypothetical protein
MARLIWPQIDLRASCLESPLRVGSLAESGPKYGGISSQSVWGNVGTSK